MDLRQLDPAIGRWMVQDPVIHHDYSPYSAFDNNPVYWSDPSGADAIQIGDNFHFSGDDAIKFFEEYLNRLNQKESTEETVSNMYEFETERDEIDTSGGGGNGNGKSKNSKEPVYHYNGKKYSDGAELYFAILLDTAAEQFGITDIIALGTAIDGLGFVDKPFQMKGASKGTSLLSKGLSSQFPQKMPWRLPTLSNNLTLKFTNVLGRFMGRTIPIIGWGVLTYDVGMTLYRTQVIYNNITN